MLIRREDPADLVAVRDVIVTAFARPDSTEEPIEAPLLDRLREDPGWIPELSLVAADPSGAVVGHVVCTRGQVGAVAAVGLGPIGVRPGRQNAGIGSALMHAVLGAADALGEPFVALLGSPAYYSRFGFRPSAQVGIAPPDPQWGEYFQVRTLTAFTPVTGTFVYAEPFQRL
ncbi:MAG: N-acetyltransferase [Hamadaea sp.]|nr:N-acetyltransferase [Hamadaea sp.]